MSLRLTKGHVIGLSIWLRGLTLEEAAREAGITAGHLSNIIKGRARLQRDQAMNLGEALGIQPRRLMNPEPYFVRMKRGTHAAESKDQREDDNGGPETAEAD